MGDSKRLTLMCTTCKHSFFIENNFEPNVKLSNKPDLLRDFFFICIFYKKKFASIATSNTSGHSRSMNIMNRLELAGVLLYPGGHMHTSIRFTTLFTEIWQLTMVYTSNFWHQDHEWWKMLTNYVVPELNFKVRMCSTTFDFSKGSLNNYAGLLDALW